MKWALIIALFFVFSIPSLQVLADYLIYSDLLHSKPILSVLDLGSGTGLVGLVAARLLARSSPSAHVHISDQA